MNDNKSILYVVDVPLTKRDIKRFGLEELENNYSVHVLQCSSYAERQYSGSQDFSFNLKIHQIDEIGSIQKFLSRYSFAVYIDLLNSSNFKIFKLRLQLYFHGVLRMIFRLNEIPILEGRSKRLNKLKQIASHDNPVKFILKKIYSKFLLFLTFKADFVLCAGDVAKIRHKNLGAKLISVNSMDYELFKSQESYENNKISVKNYALFLDQSAPNHPDYAFHDIEPPVTAEVYYPAMKSLFDCIEERLGLEVVIAAHPKNQAGNNLWGGRKVIKGETPQLVKQADLVLAHYTTAVSFAILASKPIVQLTSNEYLESIRKNRILAFRDLLNLKCINIDNFDITEINQKLHKFDKSAYELYSTNFLRSEEIDLEHMWNWDLILKQQ